MNAALSEVEFGAVAEGLQGLGYAVLRTAGDEGMLILSAAQVLGRMVGARSFGYMYLRATESGSWLGRHTESLTDGPTPLRYFASGCLVPIAGTCPPMACRGPAHCR